MLLFSVFLSGLSLPNNQQGQPNSNDSNIMAYQANLHRAFLQSAMAQNFQIQQQLLAQNQALQQLLQQQSPPVSLFSIITILLNNYTLEIYLVSIPSDE